MRDEALQCGEAIHALMVEREAHAATRAELDRFRSVDLSEEEELRRIVAFGHNKQALIYAAPLLTVLDMTRLALRQERERADALVAACQTLDDREIYHHDCLDPCRDWGVMLEAKDAIQRARVAETK